MNDAQRRMFDTWFVKGHADYLHGIPRDQCPYSYPGSDSEFVWQAGWDAGLFAAACVAGIKACFTDANPYPPASEAAAYWAKGWRETHKLTALSG